MSRSKEELIPKDTSTIFELLNEDVVEILANSSSVNSLLTLVKSSITTHNLFKPNLDKRLETLARLCVVQGDLQRLLLIAQHRPDLLFVNAQVTDPRGRTFYDVSAYQLILFLCDDDMKKHLISLIPDEFTAIRQQQSAELGHGGADLIKLDRDPLLITETDFKEITEFKTTYTLFDGTQQEVTFPMLENPDGIIYYQDADKEVHFYYANRETKEIRKLEPCFTSEEKKNAFKAFKASFNTMENNSGRRSSDVEHQLIANLLQCQLQRQGIRYEQNGIRYRDSHSAFNLINAYRKCIRFYDEAKQNGQWDKAHAYWREGVGKAQGEEMWLLQRICEKGQPFYPLPQDFNEFKRGVEFYNWGTYKEEPALSVGKLVGGLGSDFALYRGWASSGGSRSSLGVGLLSWPLIDLIAICLLVELAKANIIELKQESELDLEKSSSMLRP
jgi:hypothetical protein